MCRNGDAAVALGERRLSIHVFDGCLVLRCKTFRGVVAWMG